MASTTCAPQDSKTHRNSNFIHKALFSNDFYCILVDGPCSTRQVVAICPQFADPAPIKRREFGVLCQLCQGGLSSGPLRWATTRRPCLDIWVLFFELGLRGAILCEPIDIIPGVLGRRKDPNGIEVAALQEGRSDPKIGMQSQDAEQRLATIHPQQAIPRRRTRHWTCSEQVTHYVRNARI